MNLLINGGNDGITEYWDYRMRKKINSKILNDGEDITEINIDNSGLLMGVGGSNGSVRIYDIRYERPLLSIKH